MSLSLQKMRIVSQKIGSQADVTEVGPTDEPKNWLTINYALRESIVKLIISNWDL